jgi:hypothetical protein
MVLIECANCRKPTPESEFLVRKSGKGAGYLVSPKLCRPCRAARMQEYVHASGKHRSMSENRESPTFLGVYVAERVLSNVFKNVVKMKYGNPGYDFVCGKGYKIDVKSACLIQRHGRRKEDIYHAWSFTINKNQVADYFLCIAFDDRESLNPAHVWLFPGHLINKKYNIQIANSSRWIARWSDYEHPIEKVIECCNHIKHV